MSYLDDMHSYTVQVDTGELTEDMMTDTGVRVGDLLAIEDCYLTPGDPSPVGRTEDGDLAYIINPQKLYVSMTAKQAATLAMMLATARNITSIDALVYKDEDHKLILSLINEAASPVMFDDSAHGQIDAQSVRNAILTQGANALPDWI